MSGFFRGDKHAMNLHAVIRGQPCGKEYEKDVCNDNLKIRETVALVIRGKLEGPRGSLKYEKARTVCLYLKLTH